MHINPKYYYQDHGINKKIFFLKRKNILYQNNGLFDKDVKH